MPLELGELDNGLYKLVHDDAPHPTHVEVQPTNNKVCSLPSLCTTVSDHSLVNISFVLHVALVRNSLCNKATMNKSYVLWHNRLAHVPFVRIKTISALSDVLSDKQSFPCHICPLSRQTRLHFPDSTIHSTKSFQLIQINTWGPYHTPTHSNSKYFCTIVDNYSRSTWTHLMGSKSNAFLY